MLLRVSKEFKAEFDRLAKERCGTLGISSGDVSKLTGLSSATVTKYLKDGRLKGRKIGNRWHIWESEFFDFLERGV